MCGALMKEGRRRNAGTSLTDLWKVSALPSLTQNQKTEERVKKFPPASVRTKGENMKESRTANPWVFI